MDQPMTRLQQWPRIAVVGAGAVGGYFGGLFARSGAPVVLIGRSHFVDAVNASGLVLDKSEGQERIRAPLLPPDATVVCLQNGVDNADRIRAAANVVVLPAAVYVAVSMPEAGRVKHLARGDLIIGPPSARTTKVADAFIRAGISCRISDNIEGELWLKLLRNCALNAISALGHARYGQIARSDDAKKLMEQIVDEVLAVARAAGVVLPGVHDRESGMAAAMELATQMADAFSSTAQDLNRGQPTEIDALNGYISRRGAELRIPVPVNHALFTLVKLAEQTGVT